jgi:hypothetical protein
MYWGGAAPSANGSLGPGCPMGKDRPGLAISSVQITEERMKEEDLRLIHTYHAVPLPYRAAKGLDCVFPI